MTLDEASKCYQIPVEILQEYRRWNLCDKGDTGVWQCEDADLEKLGLMTTLRCAGFTLDEIETYMRLLLAETASEVERLRMLEQKRSAALEDIHRREQQLDRLDYLRFSVRACIGKKNDHDKRQS